MLSSRLPAVVPVLSLLAGASLAFHITAPPALVAALALAALALGRRITRPLAWLCLGLVLPVATHEVPAGLDPSRADPGRTAEVVGRISGHWRQAGDLATATLEVEQLRQGRWVFLLPRRLIVSAPAEVELPGFGSRVRMQGRIYRSSGFWNRNPTPPGPWRLYVKSARLIEVEEGPGPLAAISARLRARVDAALREAVGPGAALGARSSGVALARGLVLGDASALPESWKRGLRRWGLSHVLSVSGLHIGLVAAAALALGRGARRGFRLVLAATAVACYLALVGPLPALLRSALMAGLAAGALVLERPPQSGNSLAVAAGGLVVCQPSLVLDLGFQLTVAATAGLVFLAPRLAAAWPLLPGWLARPLAATTGAQVATLPWALPSFHLLTPAAPLANLLFVPWFSLALLVSLLWTALAVLSPRLAHATMPLLDALAAPITWLAEGGWDARWAMPVAMGGVAASALAALLFLVLLRPRALPLVGLAVALVLLAFWPNDRHGLEMVMLDVGQGDAILLRDGRRAFLIDGGGWEHGDLAGTVLLPALLSEGVRRLDAAVLSHGDSDHCRGLLDLFDYLPIDEAWTAAAPLDKRPGAGCGADFVRRAGARHVALAAGDGLRRGGWRFQVLHPAADDRLGDNDRSLVLKAEAGGRAVLLTGDLEARGELVLGRRFGPLLAADVLKVAHHGSKTSSTSAFLALSKPPLALISAGRANRYGHPAPEVLHRLDGAGIEVLRSDRLGAVRITIVPGRPLRVSALGPPPCSRVDCP